MFAISGTGIFKKNVHYCSFALNFKIVSVHAYQYSALDNKVVSTYKEYLTFHGVFAKIIT